MKNSLKSLINRFGFSSRMLHSRSLRVHDTSFLKQSGWFQSAQTSTAINSNGNAIPWMTYGSLFFIEPRLKPDFKLFEYGSGNSTLWWCERVAKVVSCEHDPQWHAMMKDKMPANSTYLFHKLENNEYPEAIMSCEDDFDVIVIDGRERNKCASCAVKKLNEAGVVIWDNSEREKYQESFDLLTSLGFKCLEFFGMGPIAISPWKTSIFYRDQNCLGI